MGKYRLDTFNTTALMECRTEFRSLFDDGAVASQEAAARRIVDFLYDSFVDDEGRPACALVRLFKTQLYEGLTPDLQAVARTIDPAADGLRDLRCLTLLATRGERDEWNSRHSSRGHKAIPLASENFVEQAPMIAQLFRQFGARVAQVIRPDRSLLLDAKETTYNVFHVESAEGSPHIPAQEFVREAGVHSVLGFGGMLMTGDVFVAIMFSRVSVSSDVADSFKVLGLNMRVALLPFARLPLFER